MKKNQLGIIEKVGDMEKNANRVAEKAKKRIESWRRKVMD